MVKLTFKSYLLWVLLPMGLAILGARHVSEERALSVERGSATRMGGLAALLFTGEMGTRTAEMVEGAPILRNPDRGSPILQAASRGDTVAALGLAAGELVLSVALAVDDVAPEPEGLSGNPGPIDPDPTPEAPLLRAVTLPFHPFSLDLFHARTGSGVALYLRGQRAAATPGDFGPARIGFSGGEAVLPRGAAAGAVLPLASSGRSPSTAHLLVAYPGRPTPPSPLGGAGLLHLSPLLLGLLAWGIAGPGRRRAPGKAARLRLLALVALPLGVFGMVLMGCGKEVYTERVERGRGDLLSVLSLLREAPSTLDPADVAARTGFETVRTKDGLLLSSTLPAGPLLEEALGVPSPPSGFPVQGTLGAGTGGRAFAAAQEAPGSTLLLLEGAPPGEALGSFFLILGGLGGLASLLPLGFLLSSAPKEGARRRSLPN